MGIDGVDLELVDIALTHKSYTYENPETAEHNERLEFLGDAVVGLAVARYLYELLPDRPEGELASLRAAVVSAPALAKQAKGLQVGQLLRLGHGEEKTGGRERESLLANAFEALVGAIYLSLGNQRAQEFVLTQLAPEIERLLTGNPVIDPKSALQEVLQKFSTEVPTYEVYKETGPDHAKEFQVVVQWRGKILGHGRGRSKKLAQQAAAREALAKMADYEYDLFG
ncbi:MAG: ribonuclease III [Firmicutes bacterium]|nr:ribonuclease III [Bacillota bacterium]